jgi:hypothetical protein
MPTNFRIRDLSISTFGGEYSYEFRAPVTTITGPIGCGKSTMLEVIKHVLGGSATLTPVIEDFVTSASLRIKAGEDALWLRRSTRSRMNIAEIREASKGAVEREVSVRESEGIGSLSMLLLNALGIPSLSIPRSRTRLAAATSSLTFNDIFTYLYLQQAEIDRSVVYHLDTYREPKRKTVFELLFGLTEPDLIALQVERGSIADQLRVAQTRAVTVRSFLLESSAGDEEELLIEQSRLTDELRRSQAELRRLRQEVSTASEAGADLRERIRLAEAESTEARTQVAGALAEVSGREALAAQLELDLRRQERLGSASRLLAQVEFVVCPRCMQSLARDVEPGEGCCLLCGQPEIDAMGESNAEQLEESKRLEAQLDETRQLLEADRERLRAVENRIRGLEVTTAGLRSELDARTTQFVTPRFEAIADASSAVARAESSLESVKRIRAYWVQLRELENSIQEYTSRAHDLDDAIGSARARLEEGRQRVSELSETFDEIVRFLEVPWYETASIDSSTYLPVVNGHEFSKLAVAGGIKTLVNLAYHLALLTITLSHDDVSMPNILIIDSPRKNLGHGAEDAALASRIYRRFRMLADTYDQRVQIIVADNDLPPIARDFVYDIHLDYDRPFVRDVTHPGPDAVKRIGAEAS